MGAKSRTKGASGEREAARLLTEALGTVVRRNLSQYQQRALPDFVVGRLAVEVKRGATYLQGWWSQAVEQAESAGLTPVLMYRLDRRPWVVEVRASDLMPSLCDPTYRASVPWECGGAAVLRELL